MSQIEKQKNLHVLEHTEFNTVPLQKSVRISQFEEWEKILFTVVPHLESKLQDF